MSSRVRRALYSGVLVPTGDRHDRDPALDVGQRLAELWGIDVRSVDARSDDVLAEIGAEPNALIVMSSHGRSRTGAVLSDLAERVLPKVADPVLLVGPHVTISSDWPAGPLLICSDGTTFSEAIVEPAAHWAKQLGIEPRLLTATDKAPILDCVDLTRPDSPMRGLTGLVESILGREVHYDLLHGDEPAAVILDHARWHQASMLALATHGRGGLSRLTKGSVAMRVLRRAACPVLVRGPFAGPGAEQ